MRRRLPIDPVKIQFKHKTYQANAVDAVVDCFAGQPKVEGVGYRLDPGNQAAGQAQAEMDYGTEAFRNGVIMLDGGQLLGNIQKVQRSQNLPQSTKLVTTRNCDVNLDVEMETGTGKTYVYIRTMFELNRRYGWSKFIVVVPSIAIREGVQKSLEITAGQFSPGLRQEGPLLHLRFEASPQAGKLLLGRRHQRDGDQCPGLQCPRQRRPADL